MWGGTPLKLNLPCDDCLFAGRSDENKTKMACVGHLYTCMLRQIVFKLEPWETLPKIVHAIKVLPGSVPSISLAWITIQVHCSFSVPFLFRSSRTGIKKWCRRNVVSNYGDLKRLKRERSLSEATFILNLQRKEYKLCLCLCLCLFCTSSSWSL